MRAKLVLFDIDGTLIRTGGAGVKAFEKTFEAEFGLPEATKTLNFAGRTDRSLVRECFKLHGIELSDRNFDRFFAVYPKFLSELLPLLPGGVCEGVTEFMEALGSRPAPPQFGLLTGNVRHGAELKLTHYKLWSHFPFGAFGDDHEDRNCIAGIAKERGQQYLKQNLRGEEIIVIGDTAHDVTCGKSIGARVIAVGTGNFRKEELAQSKPDWSVDHLGQMDLTEI